MSIGAFRRFNRIKAKLYSRAKYVQIYSLITIPMSSPSISDFFIISISSYAQQRGDGFRTNPGSCGQITQIKPQSE